MAKTGCQWVNHLHRADTVQARQIAAELRQLGDMTGDIVARVMACRTIGYTSLVLGDFAAARAYFEEGIALYDPSKRRSYAALSPADTLTAILAFSSIALTCSGYIDQGRSYGDRALAEARRLSHTTSLLYALWATSLAGWVSRSEPRVLLRVADELLELSAGQRLPLWRAEALEFRGWCLVSLGCPDDGIPLLAAGLADVRSTGTRLYQPECLTRMADGCRLAGQSQTGLAHIAEAEQIAEATEVRWFAADTLRLRGELLMQTGDRAGAEASFRDAIALARRQDAKLFELRASTSLGLLWHDHGRGAEARDLLAPVVAWFTEGFDAPDLRDAKALLDNLEAV